MNTGTSRSLVAALLLLMVTACSDSSDHRQPTPEPPIEPEPVTDLSATGIYHGTLETEQGDVALMTLTLARTGETSITFETDDSEQASIILWGESEGDENEISFSGSDANNGDSVALDLLVSEQELTGELDMASLKGSFSLSQSVLSERASDLENVAGQYARQDAIEGQTVLEIDTDGNASLSGICDASGSISIVDDQVNIYLLTLSSDCADIQALVSSEDIETAMDVLSLTGSSGDKGINAALFRL